jgi:hypothetical protein
VKLRPATARISLPSMRIRHQPKRRVAALSDVPASEVAADPDCTAVETKRPAVKGAMLHCDEAKDRPVR